jgi:hypothetical protein
MPIPKIILLGFVLALISCGQTKEEGNNPDNEKSEMVFNMEGYKKDSFQLAHEDKAAIRSIIFGVYCGECGSNCATMYGYIAGNAQMFLVDSSDSYFHNKGEIKFAQSVNDHRRSNLAKTVIKQIPNKLLTTTKLVERFGCPDCTDGCGIYFELTQGNSVKKFYIDYNTLQLSAEIKKFAEFLKTTINQLNSKT